MSKTSAREFKQKLPLDKVDLNAFDNLVVVELETDLLSEEERRMIAEIKSTRNTAPFLPASSCRRHVYILRREDLDEKTTPILCSFVRDNHKDGKVRVYSGGCEAMKFLATWVSGGLNGGKHLNDKSS